MRMFEYGKIYNNNKLGVLKLKEKILERKKKIKKRVIIDNKEFERKKH